MRLYLSSFRLGDHPDRLVKLIDGYLQAAVIVNACDLYPKDGRQDRVRQEIASLGALGIQARELDLRHYFDTHGDSGELEAALGGCGLVWVRGGNAFVLRRAMAKSGFDNLIMSMLKSDRIVYGGFSAGVDMLCPSLLGVELVDDPYTVPTDYDRTIVWEGLGILSYCVAPHYRSDHPESADVEKLVQYYIDNHVLFKAIRDGQVIVVHGESEEILV